MEVDEQGKTTALKAAQISLADCLACSGCITSAESVLVNAQSSEKFIAMLAEKPHEEAPLVVSLSPQAVASLATHFGLSLQQTTRKLCAFFTEQFGAAAVLDETVGFEISVAQVTEDFLARLEKAKTLDAKARKQVLPLLASECPGWVCYAEKTHPETLPNICTAKSAMTIVAEMAKRHFGKQCIHASVQPCFDKKLEASRSDFRAEDGSEQDVDIVLATTEVIDLIGKRSVDFSALPELPLADLMARCTAKPFSDVERAAWAREDGPFVPETLTSCGGGYLENAMRTACVRLFGVPVDDTEAVKITQVKGRNADLREYVLKVRDGEPLRFAFAYGFRNIQNVVRKIKTGTCNYHFVEIMACPHACVNGGGQIKPPKEVAPEVWLQRVKSVFDARPYAPVTEQRVKDVLACYPDIQLHTVYHDRKDSKPASLTQIKW